MCPPCLGFEIIVELSFLSYKCLKTKNNIFKQNTFLFCGPSPVLPFPQTNLSKTLRHGRDVQCLPEVDWYGVTHLRVLY